MRLAALATLLLFSVACSGDVTLSEDVYPPEAEFLWPPADGDILQGADFELAVSITDRDNDNSELAFRAVSDLDGILPGEARLDDLGATLPIAGDLLQAGYHTVTATIGDDTHVVEIERSFWVRPNTAPSINFVQPTSSDVYLSSENILVEASVFDAEEADLASITLVWNGIGIDQPTASTHPDTDGSVAWFLPRLPAGNYTLGVLATDSVGASRSNAVTFEVIPTDGDGDGWISAGDGGPDCDDTNFQIHPAQLEACNGIDDNCNGDIDEDAVDAGSWYTDGDGDGYGAPASRVVQCLQPPGTLPLGDDCDDTDDQRSPGTDEICDGIDNDCNGLVDDEPVDGTPFYVDADGDTYGDLALGTTACELSAGVSPVAGDCDDSRADAYPGADEICGDGADNNCDGAVDEACIIERCGTIDVAEVWTSLAVHRITCPVEIESTVTVQEGARIEWDDGSAFIRVGDQTNGRLLVQGSAAAPVTIEPARTGYQGRLIFGRFDTGSVLEHTDIRRTGVASPAIVSDADHLILRNLTLTDIPGDGVRGDSGVLTLQDSVVDGVAGIGLLSAGTLASLSGTDFDNALVAPVEIGADDIGAIGTGNDFTGNVQDVIRVRPGRVSEDVTWSDRGAPYQFLGSVQVGDLFSDPVLTLADGLTLTFPAGANLDVGVDLPGTLVVDDSAGPVTLTAHDPAQPWGGVVFGAFAAQPTLEGLIIDHAGGAYEDAGLALIDGVDLRIEGATVLDSYGSGIRLLDGATAEIVGNVVEGNQVWGMDLGAGVTRFSNNEVTANRNAVRVRVDAVDAFDGTSTWSGNTDEWRILVTGSSLKKHATWVAEPVPYRIDHGLHVRDTIEHTLTLTRGLILEFDAGTSMSIGETNNGAQLGHLEIAPGTGRVELRGSAAPGAPGDWGGLSFGAEGTAGSLAGLTIRNANTGIYLSGTGPPITIEDVEIHDVANYGVRLRSSGDVSIDGLLVDGAGLTGFLADSSCEILAFDNSRITGTAEPASIAQTHLTRLGASNDFSGNVDDAVYVSINNQTIPSGSVYDPGVPFRFPSGVQISGSSPTPHLTLHAGVEWQLGAGTSVHLGDSYRSGLLTAQGSAANPVVFTGAEASPAPGDWEGIELRERSVLTLDNTIVEYAGQLADGTSVGNIRSYHSSEGMLTDVDIAESAGHGLWWDSSNDPVLTGVTFTNIALTDVYYAP